LRQQTWAAGIRRATHGDVGEPIAIDDLCVAIPVEV
jgi:hypothetical protein